MVDVNLWLLTEESDYDHHANIRLQQECVYMSLFHQYEQMRLCLYKLV